MGEVSFPPLPSFLFFFSLPDDGTLGCCWGRGWSWRLICFSNEISGWRALTLLAGLGAAHRVGGPTGKSTPPG